VRKRHSIAPLRPGSEGKGTGREEKKAMYIWGIFRNAEKAVHGGFYGLYYRKEFVLLVLSLVLAYIYIYDQRVCRIIR